MMAVAEIGAGSVIERVTARMSAKRTRAVMVRPARDFARRREPMRSARWKSAGRKMCWAKGFLAERRLGAGGMGAAVGLDLARVAVEGERAELFAGGDTDEAFERAAGRRGELADGGDALGRELCLGHRADAPHQLDRQVVEPLELDRGVDDDEAVGLGHLRGDLGEMLCPRDADRDREADLLADAAADGLRRLSAGGPKRCSVPATSAKASSIEMRSTSGV